MMRFWMNSRATVMCSWVALTLLCSPRTSVSRRSLLRIMLALASWKCSSTAGNRMGASSTRAGTTNYEPDSFDHSSR